jgi:phenylacetic acid degradation operon negative regulatory protein
MRRWPAKRDGLDLPRPTAPQAIIAVLQDSRRGLSSRKIAALADVLGISANTLRPALSRLVAEGVIQHLGDCYRVVGRRDRLLLPAQQAVWDGSWALWAVGPGQRTREERESCRRWMQEHRFAELHDRLWLRPRNLVVDPTPNGALRRSAAPMTATVEAPRKLAADLWNLDRLNGQGNDLIRACREVIDDLGLDERFSFAHRVLRAAELLHMADPLLPVELQPAGWPSADLRIWSEALRSRWDDEAAHRRRTLR